ITSKSAMTSARDGGEAPEDLRGETRGMLTSDEIPSDQSAACVGGDYGLSRARCQSPTADLAESAARMDAGYRAADRRTRRPPGGKEPRAWPPARPPRGRSRGPSGGA